MANSNEYMNKYMIERYKKRRSEAIITLGSVCMRCSSLEDLHIHHKDPSQKSFTLAKGSSYSKDRWDKEVEKCILLCSSCHTAEHQSKVPCGTPQRYWRGCRCSSCKKANTDHNREYKRSRATREQSRDWMQSNSGKPLTLAIPSQTRKGRCNDLTAATPSGWRESLRCKRLPQWR